MSFEQSPRPEINQYCDFTQPDKPQDMLTVGIQTRTESPSGLKIIPTKEVVFSIGKTIGNPEERSFGLMASPARALAIRIIEFCDAIEKEQ